MGRNRFEAAIAAIDAANADDPETLEVRGEIRPKELAHAELASEWTKKLAPEASEALLLAARAHHLKRWTIRRSAYSPDRKGYLVWRQKLAVFHADETAQILERCGYDIEMQDRVGRIILRKNLREETEAQVLEDALCLVFFETQLADLATRLEPEKMRDVAFKTLRKMSPRGHALSLELPLASAHRALLRELIEAL